MHTIFIESDTVETLEFKDSGGKPLLTLNVVKIGADEVPTSAIYQTTSEEMQVLAYLINKKHGEQVQVKQASVEHNQAALGQLNLIGKFMAGDSLSDGTVLFKAIKTWKQSGLKKVSLCFFNPVALTYPDGMEHLVHTSILSVVNAIRSEGLEVEYTVVMPMNVQGVAGKVADHFGDQVISQPIPISLEDLMAYDGVWDLSTITPIDNASEVVLELLGVPTINSQETHNDSSNTESAHAVPENSATAPVGLWLKIWRQILRLFGVRV